LKKNNWFFTKNDNYEFFGEQYEISSKIERTQSISWFISRSKEDSRKNEMIAGFL